MTSVVRVENLVKSYGKLVAVKEISFRVEAGEIFSLLAPNGAGKTTTIEILEGLRKRDSGTVEVLGHDVEDLSLDVKRRIRVMFQETALMENLKVWETIKLFSSVYGVRPNPDILEILGLKSRADTLVRKLSGGQKRRLAFALTMIGESDLMFLDEPTTGLDPQARRVVWDVLKDMKESGRTIFLTTHYMDEAEYLSDRICIMDNGQIIAMGSFEEIVSSSGLKSVVEYTIRGETKTVETDEPERVLEDLFKSESVERVALRKPNLEDVFLKLTGRRLRD